MKKFNAQIMLAVIGFIFILLYLFVSFIGLKEVSDDSAVKKSPYSFELFYRLFTNLDYKIEKWPGQAPLPDSDFIMILNYQDYNKDFIESLLPWVEQGGNLFIAGVISEEDPIFQYKLDYYKKIDKLEVAPVISQDVRSISADKGRMITSELEDDQKLIYNDEGTVLYQEKYGSGNVFLLSDSSFLTDRQIQHEDIAILTNNILKTYFRQKIYVKEFRLNYIESADPMGIFFKGKLFLLTLQLIILGLFFVAWKGIRFGNPISIDLYSRRSLSEHLQGVGQFYQKAKAFQLMDKTDIHYFIYVLEKNLRLSYKNNSKRIIHYLTKEFGISETEIRDLLEVPGKVSVHILFTRKQKRDKIIQAIHGQK